MIAGRAARWAPSATIAAAVAAMTWWTWGKWPDVLVDFGWELYAAWQILEGKVLYRDLAWLSGPLPPYVNATWFQVFGVSLRTIVLVNLAMMALLIGLMWKVFTAVTSRFAATVALLVFVTLFAFSQLSEIGNYNFITPYSQGVTHGVVFAFAGIACLRWFLRSTRARAMAVAGTAVGLTLLCKAEVSLAAAAALTIGYVAALRIGAIPREKRLRSLIGFVTGVVVPLAVAVAFFSRHEPVASAVPDALGAWRFVVTGSITAEGFFRRIAGLDDPVGSVRAMMAPLAVVLVVFGAAAAAAFKYRRASTRDRFAIPLSIALAAFSSSTRILPWERAAQTLPLIMVLLLAVFGYRAFFNGALEPAAGRRAVMQVTLVTFAFVLLWKMALNPTFYHYGFALAMPATLVVVATLLDWIPAALTRRGGIGVVFQAVGLAAIATLVATHLMAMSQLFSRKTEHVGLGADAFLADARGREVREALSEIAGRVRPDQTLVVLPEGVMLNYLSRRLNPIPYMSFISQSLKLFGEPTVLTALNSHPPDFIALVHEDTTEMGGRFFGQDYGRMLMSWITDHYKEVRLVGAQPFLDGRFGIVLMQRNLAE